MQVYSDTTDSLAIARHCIQEVKASFYHHWLLRSYALKCAPALEPDLHCSGYISACDKPAC